MTKTTLTRDQYRTMADKLVNRLYELSPEDASRFEAALEQGWDDSATLAELCDDLNTTIKELVAWLQ